MILPSIESLLKQHHITPQKKFGQHFLLDAHITDNIVRHAGNLNNATILEIGPGPGGLTRSLLATKAKKIIIIEKDTQFLPLLQPLVELAPEKLVFIEGDALRYTLNTHTEQGEKLHIIANLPYSVGTLLLLQWLEHIDFIASMTLMFQKEVAERLCALPGTKAYGSLSVFSQYLCDIEHQMDIDPRYFTPPPKVSSSVVRLVPRAEKFPCKKESLEKLCAVAFSHRRKTLRNNLKTLCNNPLSLLRILGLHTDIRPDAVSVKDYCAMACLIDLQ